MGSIPEPSWAANDDFHGHTIIKYHDVFLPDSVQGRTVFKSSPSPGWLIKADETYNYITLFYPFLQDFSFNLPPLFNPSELTTTSCFLHKAILSTDPFSDPSEFAVMVIYGKNRQLAWYKSGNPSWVMFDLFAGMYYDDVIWHEGKFYAVDEYGKVVEIRIQSGMPCVRLVTERWSFDGNKLYIVGICGQLLVVFRETKEFPELGYNFTDKFIVFKLRSNGSPQKIGKFNGFALFLGHRHSTWSWADDTHKIMNNCIYFTDDHNIKMNSGVASGHDVGCYNINDNSIVHRFETW